MAQTESKQWAGHSTWQIPYLHKMLIGEVDVGTLWTQVQHFHDVQSEEQVWASGRNGRSKYLHIGVVDHQGQVLTRVVRGQVLQRHNPTIELHLEDQGRQERGHLLFLRKKSDLFAIALHRWNFPLRGFHTHIYV